MRLLLTLVVLVALAAAPARAGVLTPDGYSASPGGAPIWLGVGTDKYGGAFPVIGVWEGGLSAAQPSGFGSAPGWDALSPGACMAEDQRVECGLPAGGGGFLILGSEDADAFREVSCALRVTAPCPRVFRYALGAGDDELITWNFASVYDPDRQRWVPGADAAMPGVLVDAGPGNDHIALMGGPTSGRIDAGSGDDRIFTKGGYGAAGRLVDGPFEIICGPGYDVVEPGPADSIAADCEQIGNAYDDPAPAPSPPPAPEADVSGADVGLVCGRARFDFHRLNVDLPTDFVRRGERACLLAASNRVTRELLAAGAGGLSTAIVREFGDEIAAELGDDAARHGARKRLERQGKTLLRKLLPEIGRAIRRTHRMDEAGELAAALMIPYAAGKHLQHVQRYNGCTRLLVDVDKRRLKVAGGLLYSPTGLERPTADGELTRVSVYEREPRRLRRDQFVRRGSSLRCDEQGMIQGDGRGDARLFHSPQRLLLPG